MSFHTPVKALNPVDTKLPDHVVKGAVIVDEQVGEWNEAVSLDSTAAMSTFIIVDKQADALSDVVSRVAAELKLPPEEQFSLVFEEPRAFLTVGNMHRLCQGFMLTLTAAPCHFARRLHGAFSNRSSSPAHLEWAIGKMDQMAMDPCFVRALLEVMAVDLLYDLVEDDRVNSSATGLSLLLQSISKMFDLSLHNDVTWTNAPLKLIKTLATLVTGRAKREDSNTVLVALEMIEKLVNCDNVELRSTVLSEVPLHTLIRHLEKSDERVSLAALSLMNALHRNSDGEGRQEIIKHLSSKPFLLAVTTSVLREGRVRDRPLLQQLVPLQRLLLHQLFILSHTTPEADVLDALLSMEELRVEGVDGISDDVILLESSGLGQLAVNSISSYVQENRDDLRILVSENTMRVGGDGWQLMPMLIQCIRIVTEMLGIGGAQTTVSDTNNGGEGDVEEDGETDCVECLIELLFSVDNPFDVLLSITIQLFHRTWREMHAASSEAAKVGNVVREQLRRSASRRPASGAVLEESLEALPYWKMQELWKREQTERENDELGSQTASELRELLRPSIEQLVRTNRKNFMKQGYTFKRQLKGKTPQKDQYWFWRLDAAEKVITMTETDSDPYLEGTSHAGKVRKVCIKEIASVRCGEDGSATVRKGAGLLRGLRVTLHDGEVLTASASADRALCSWLDGLMDLLGEAVFSRDASRIAERLLNVELRLRLSDIGPPRPPPPPEQMIPPLPKDFSWIKPHLNRH